MIIAICSLMGRAQQSAESSLSSASPRTLFWNALNGHKALACKKWQCTARRELYVKNTEYEKEQKERISPVQALNAKGKAEAVGARQVSSSPHMAQWLLLISIIILRKSQIFGPGLLQVTEL